MSKNTNFTGQPVYNQVINLLDKAEIVRISREAKGSEAYVKRLDGYQHLIVMLFGVLKHFDQKVRFTRGELTHEARRVEIFEEKKKPVVLLTNNFDFSVEDISEIYHLRWAIESLHKQLKQTFPLHSSMATALMPYRFKPGWFSLPICSLLCSHVVLNVIVPSLK